MFTRRVPVRRRLRRNVTKPQCSAQIVGRACPRCGPCPQGTVKRSRWLLRHADSSDWSDPSKKSVLEAAERVVKRQDSRNRRKKTQRAKERELLAGGCGVVEDCPPGHGCTVSGARAVSTVSPAVSEGQVHDWEEVLGPEGETIRFRLYYRRGSLYKRTLSKAIPGANDIVLDLRTGIKAYRITAGRRRPVKVSKAMWAAYRNSFLYQARMLAARKTSLSEFKERIKDMDNMRRKI